MPLDEHPHDAICREQFPQLWAAIEATQKLFKKIRHLRNQGGANDKDVEAVRNARNLLLTVRDAGNWIED